MSSDYLNDYSYLDQIRINEGVDTCKDTLNNIFRKDAGRAIALLNDHRLTFPCLYILRGQILRYRIHGYLNPRNRTAIRIANQIGESETSGADYLSSKQDSIHSVLKWILETSSTEEIPEYEYEEILDVTASVLINIYRDMEILPLVVELIFTRNRNGRCIHDLVWALFCFHDPEVLKLIARHILSSDPKDTELAAELLNINETDVPAEKNNREGWYTGYLHWLEENQSYLYFTEESFQYTSKPTFCAVDLERKYMQKSAPSYDKQPISLSDDEENKSVAAFKHLSTKEQKVLSEYSHKIYRKNVPAWKEWMHTPVKEQIKAAKAGSEGEK